MTKDGDRERKSEEGKDCSHFIYQRDKYDISEHRARIQLDLVIPTGSLAILYSAVFNKRDTEEDGQSSQNQLWPLYSICATSLQAKFRLKSTFGDLSMNFYWGSILKMEL